jgi:acyl-coenzyme A thioesterase PaaI-like protein
VTESDFAERIATAKRERTFASLVDGIPYAKFLGFSLRVDGAPDGSDGLGPLVGVLGYAPRNIGNSALPALHGGTLGALLELTAMFELLWRSDAAKLPKVIGCTIEYLRSGKPQETFAAAQIVRQGRRVAPLRVVAWQDDRSRPIASASVQFLIG